MLKELDFTSTATKNDNKARIKAFREELAGLQETIKARKLPIAIVFEGWSASGKGSMISELISQLDPRSFRVSSSEEADASELRRPFLWRFWKRIPAYGRIAIFDRSWYRGISTDRVEKKISDELIKERMDSINTFERQLTDDGYLVLKFFLHISKKEQAARLEALLSDKATAWRVTGQDIKRNKNYKKLLNAYEEMCVGTNTVYAPWRIIPARDRDFAVCSMYEGVLSAINSALDTSTQKAATVGLSPMPQKFDVIPMARLSDVNLTVIPSATNDYAKELKEQQKILFELQNKLYCKKIPVVLAFEGWDAAGKGGAIKRVAAALDPRGYEAIPVAAPSTDELAHHYLRRFWLNVPKTGHTAMFDRSWYGRVMVERVEGYTPKERWQEAYQEINEFEWELTKSGCIVVKFWMQIDKDEQLARFTDRQNTPEKQWKITADDWRNREKWDVYEVAVDEMIAATSTEFAPWHIIPAKDKEAARIAVLKTLIAAIEKYLS